MNCKRSTNIPSSVRKIAYYTPFMVQSSHALVTDLSKLYVNSFTFILTNRRKESYSFQVVSIVYLPTLSVTLRDHKTE